MMRRVRVGEEGHKEYYVMEKKIYANTFVFSNVLIPVYIVYFAVGLFQ